LRVLTGCIEFAGTKYIKNTLEYQRMLWRRDLWGVVFIDNAKKDI